MTALGATTHDDLLAALDLPSKVRLLTGASLFTLHGEASIGLQEITLSDGPTGVRGLTLLGGQASALLPNATLLAATWDERALHEVGQVLADEAERKRVHVVLGPTINLHRSPLGGRLFEAYSEDPLLTGRLAAAYVQGLQERDIGACLKHLVANESETERHTMNSQVDEATLREVYLLPFEIAVADADPWSIMAAYNAVNGVPATEQHHVMNEIVKGEWGYRGLIVSDWSATKTTVPSANGGLDLVMPGPGGPWGERLIAAVRAGDVPETVVDDHVRRLLLLAERVEALGQGRRWSTDVPEPDSRARREQLTVLAARGMTVLTNSGVLPLERQASLALIGRHALETCTLGGGSAKVRAPHHTSIEEGLRAALGDRLHVVDGVEVRSRAMPAVAGVLTEPERRPGTLLTSLGAGSAPTTLHLPDNQTFVGFGEGLETPVTAVRLTGRIRLRGRVQIGVIGVGHWRVTVGGEEFEVDLAPSRGGLLRPPSWTTEVDVDADALLEATVHAEPTLLGTYALAAQPAPRPPAEVIAEAAAAARASEVAVVVVGLTEEQESEAADKDTLALPGAQDELVTAVAAAARRTVVVVNAATPVLMPWADQVDAILWAGLPGQEAGHAVAAALLGDVEPAGRLVTSFPAADGASPAWSVTPTDGTLHYAEEKAVGYRGYAAGHAPAPAFWFGHGLGYGSWDYGPVTLEGGGARGWSGVCVPVTNTGARRSREVVQLYLQPGESGEPIRLVGWSAAEVGPGETETVHVTADPRLLRRWDSAQQHWAPLIGGELLIARGLGDIRARLTLGAGTR